MAGFVFVFLSGTYADEIYQTPASFLNEVFENNVPAVKKIWLTGEVKEQVTKILRHPPKTLRTRYWYNKTRSAWILSEVGKERDITVGVVIKHNRIEKIKVLIFRESRGSEVRHGYFTRQFKSVQLSDNLELNKDIDGITGATLSVRALKKIATLALYLNKKIES